MDSSQRKFRFVPFFALNIYIQEGGSEETTIMAANSLVLDKPLPLISYSDSGILGLKTCGLVAHGNQSDSSFYFSNAVQKM